MRMLLAIFAAVTLVPLAASAQETIAGASDQPWWDTHWRQRYEVVFENLDEESGAEIGLVTFSPQMDRRGDPYDVRAVVPPSGADDKAATVPISVLYWSPGGEVTCLVAIEPLMRRKQSTLFLYLDNPEAVPGFYDYPWQSPLLLIGSKLGREYRRHGEWIWRRDNRFGAVHVGTSADNASSRSSHSVTGFPPVSCHPRHGRIVQMVWLDPSDPPAAVGMDLMSEGKITSAYWCAGNPPADAAGTSPVLRLGPLPPTGKWTRLTVTGEQLNFKERKLIEGIGFSTHGGTVKWGPTAFGALPANGAVARRQILVAQGEDEWAVETINVAKAAGATLTSQSLRLNIVSAPLFIEPGAALPLTLFISPWYKYAGDLPDCEIEVHVCGPSGPGGLGGPGGPSGLGGLGGARRAVREQAISFTGGDNWQGTIEVAAADWTGAQRVEVRLLRQGRLLTTTGLRLIPAGAIPPQVAGALRANGNLLQAGADAVSCVAQAADKWKASRRETLTSQDTKAATTQTLVFTSGVYGKPGADEATVNGDDARLGLQPPVSPYARRTAAEWVVAAARAATAGTATDAAPASGAPMGCFRGARIVVTRDIMDIGLNLTEVEIFLRGMIEILKSNPRLTVAMDATALREETLTKRERALLVHSLEAQSLLEP